MILIKLISTLLLIIISAINVSADVIKAKLYIKNEEYAQAYKELKNDNSPESNSIKGFLYKNGLGISKNLYKAFNFYLLAAKAGNRSAQYYLIQILDDFADEGIKLPLNESERKKWRSMAIANYTKIPNKTSEDMYRLGDLYNPGIGIGGKDKAISNKWFIKSAELGHMSAQSQLGIIYESGDGVKVDKTKAAYWFKKAAAQGDEFSLNRYKKSYAEK